MLLIPAAFFLQALADIFALKRIHDDILFRNDEFVGADKSKAIQHLLESLYREVRGVALPLVDAFEIPDFILRAPIGMSTLVTNPYADYLHSIGWE
jgi:acyl-CoA oxidase